MVYHIRMKWNTYTSSCIHSFLWYTTYVCIGIFTLVHVYTRSYCIPHTYVMEYLL